MNTTMKRVLSLILCFVLATSYLPAGALAAQIGETAATAAAEAATEPTPAASEETEAAGESEETAEPSEESAEPSEEATEPSEEATEPSEEATEPSEGATEPSEEATEPSEEATEPSEEATEPSEEATEPSEEATEPSEEATEPSEEATEPSAEATEPEVIAVTGITLDQTALTVGVGELPITLTATVLPEDATDKTVIWTSSEPGVVSVEDGVLTFGYMGEATVTAAAGEFSASCTVTVGEGDWATFDPVEGVLDSAIFCSDVHGSTSDLSSVLSGVAASGVDYSAIGFVGDTCLTVAETSSTVRSALGDEDISVMFSYAASHDTEKGADISEAWDYSGEVEAVSDDYLVYTIRETDMQNNNTSEEAFASWYSALSDAQKQLPIFIMSHRPLHARRNDNANAADWYAVISAAAESSDIVFFWAHNHTSESSVDTNAYYVAKDGNETMTVYNGDTVTPNFTYMNAGYINANNQNPGRIHVATTVQITEDSLVFQDYTTTGAYTGEYEHNVTVEREFAAAEEPSVTEQTFYSEDTFAAVTATAENGIVTDIYDESNTAVNALLTDWYGYDISLEGQVEGTAATVTLWLPPESMSSENLAVYYYNEETAAYEAVTDYTVAADDEGVEYITIANAALGTYVYGTPNTDDVIPEDAVLESIEITTPAETTKYFENDTQVITDENGEELTVIAVDIAGMVVEANYALDGETYSKTIEWNKFDSTADGYALTSDPLTDGENVIYGAKTVTLTYNEKTAAYTIWVCATETVDETTNTSITFDSPSVVSVEVAALEADETVTAALTNKLEGTLAVYNITPTYANGDTALTGNAAVTLPIPEGVTNPAVYYVSDDGATVEKMPATVNEDGTLTFTTTHFSTYVVGESTDIVVEDPTTATGSGTATTTEEKEVYVLVSTPTAGNQYIIVSSGSAGTGYALKENTTTGSSVTINAATAAITAPYIETSDTTIMWNATTGLNFQSVNGGYYLNYSNNGSSLSFGTSSASASDWTAGTNQLYRNGNRNDYYLRYNNGTWTMGNSNSTHNVYFYEKQTVTVETTTTVSGTYSIAGEDLTVLVAEGSTAALSGTLTFTPSDDGTATTTDVSATATYEVVSGGDPNGVITGISGNTATFSGKYGKALVKVSYTTNFGVVTNYITVEAIAPYYTIDLCEAVTDDNGTTTYESITAPVALKGVVSGDTYSVWAVVKEHTSANPDGKDMGDLADNALTWSVSDESIATIDPATGVIKFTGTNYGTFTVTVSYKGSDNKVITDMITISATASQYVVPGDGTNDFPEYPNQGAIRIDKTATAVGSFSQTGIAKVELSMTGVPYGTNAVTDVVIMVDMTASMEDNDVTAAENAVKAMIEALVYDEENDVYDTQYQIFLDVFYSASTDSSFATETYFDGITIGSETELTAALAKIDFTQSSQGGGTRYNLAMKAVYDILMRDGHAEKQFAVFVSDGVATAYAPLTNGALGTTITGNNSETSSLAAGWFDDSGEVTDEFETEYYSYLIKSNGIPMYTVGANLTALSDAADVLNHMSSNYSPDGKTATGETKYSFFCTTSSTDSSAYEEIFEGIAASIREAATNVVVEDKVGDDYSLNFSLPTGVTSDEAGMSEFYIQVLDYQLDENKERTGDPTVLENFTFNSNGTLKSHTVNGTACESCSHVTIIEGTITKIDGTYFDYEAKDDGEYLTWNADKLSTTELVLEYFAYLDNSAGADVNVQVPAGTYYTNEYATITYDNYLGNRVQQEFPIPQMTWNGAQVTYVFYLVNTDGQPVNRAGRVIPFAEAVYVTTPVTYNVTWNEQTGIENILAHDIFATAGVPDVYALYDEQAQYVIRVYQTENVDENGVNGNYFQISGSSDKLIDSVLDSDTTVDNSTTVVFNTKAGKKYDEYGYYSIYNVGTELTNGTSTFTTTVKADDIDYANTTVAFAVVWKPELEEDTVVVDYGLDVVIDVTTNDNMAAGVVGVRTDAPKSGENVVTMNSGTYTSAKNTSVNVSANDITIGTATVENNKSVRFSLNKTNGMQFSEPVQFYYEADVNYYTYDNEGTATLNTTSMYSRVTVIPATTIYYEDSFLTLESYTKGKDGTYAKDATSKWTASAQNGVQAQDRPGASKISADLDADNNYGFDLAYETMSTHSLNNAAHITVDTDTRGEATFTFFGTGFDVIGVTSNKTGTLIVQIYSGASAAGTAVETSVVDTYYSYAKNANGEWVVSQNADNALYQVPVMKHSGLKYGQYTVKIVAGYNEYFDHTATAGSYDLYLDAIRIYDPTGNQNDTANNAYVADGEGWPSYFELRDKIIPAATFDSLSADDSVDGIVFIDGSGNIGTADIGDYESYGPNNEVYLDVGHALAFDLNATATAGSVAKVQLAVKTVGGTGSVQVYGVDKTTKAVTETVLDTDISTATDMYYDITALNGQTMVIKNSGESGDAIVSVTNVKVTYTAAQTTVNDTGSDDSDGTDVASVFSIRRSSADAALATMSVTEDTPEETVPETTESEDSETETTVPDESEPEETEPEETETETTEPEETEPEDSESKQEQIINFYNKIVNTVKNILSGLLKSLF